MYSSNLEGAVPCADARSCPWCWSSGSLVSSYAESSHSQESAYQASKLKRDLRISAPHSRLSSLRDSNEEAPHRAAPRAFVCAKRKHLASLLFFSEALEVFFSNTGTCSAATRTATLTFGDMCLRRASQLKSLLAVLVLAAAAVQTRGQGKNLELARTSWGLFRLLPCTRRSRGSVLGKGTRFTTL